MLAVAQSTGLIIERCANRDFRPMLADYFDRARPDGYSQHSPGLLSEALSWHQCFVTTLTVRI